MRTAPYHSGFGQQAPSQRSPLIRGMRTFLVFDLISVSTHNAPRRTTGRRGAVRQGSNPGLWVTGGIAWAKVHIRSIERIVIRQGKAAPQSPVAMRSAQALDSSSPPLQRWRRPDGYVRFAGSVRAGLPRRGRVVPARTKARGPGPAKRQRAPEAVSLARHRSRPGSDPTTRGPDATESGARRSRRFVRCRSQWRNRATSIAAATRLRKARRSCRREEFGSFSYHSISKLK